MEQYSDEWWAARLGKVTASKVSDVMMKPTTAGYANYQAQLIAERLTGTPTESYTNAAMQWGTDTEPLARAAYDFFGAGDVTEIGFVSHPTIAMSGASPDGLVGDKGLLEIKCPNIATHLSTLRGKPIDGKYIKQIQWQMACTDRQWCDFASFDPRMPIEIQLHVIRVERDDELIAEMEAAVTAFLAEVDEAVADLQSRFMRQPEPELTPINAG